MTPNEHIGQIIKKARESEKLTQDQLADKSGITRTHIGRIERGEINITIDTLHKICTALGYLIDIRISPMK